MFLFSVYLNGSGTTGLSDETVDETIRVLELNNVSVDKSLIKKNFENIKVCNVENSYATPEDMIEGSADGEYVAKAGLTSDEKSFTYVPESGSKLYKLDIKNAAKELEKAGLLKKGEYAVVQKEGGMCFYLKFEDKVFFDSYLYAKQKDGTVYELYGYNMLGDAVSEGSLAETVSISEILINFATSGNETHREITSLRAGYYIGTRDGTVRATASPVWQIKTSDGNIFYYDMRNGDLLD